MKNTEAVILQELNKLNDEVFRLYYLGYHNEAVKEANNLLLIASKKLGHQHPVLSTLQENFLHMKKQPRDKASYLNKKTLAEKKNRIEDLKRDIMVTDYLDPILEVPEAKTTSTNLKRAVIFICLLLIMGQGAFATVYIKGFYKNRAVTDVSGINTVMEKPQTRIFDNKLKGKVNFEVPLIQQYPQLPRGCEVTSLAMLLQYAGIDVDKMTLAREILKDPTPFKRINGKTYFGNPNDGFVGDMYSLKNPGYGVYHGPILKLLEEYMPGQTVNLTGRSFGDLLYFVNKEIPVWVITNTRYKELENNQFQVWETPTGPVKITYRQHAVIITGYDEKYIYINDPLYNGANRKINRSNFEAAWIQMGQQAVSYIPEGEELHSILPPEEQ